MKENERKKMASVIIAYGELKKALWQTSIHTTKLANRIEQSYKNAFALINSGKEEEAIQGLADTIKFTGEICVQHKKMEGIIADKFALLAKTIHENVDQDEYDIEFYDERIYEIAAKPTLENTINGFELIGDMLDEYNTLLLEKGKTNLVEATTQLRGYIKENLVPYYSALNTNLDLTLKGFNEQKRGSIVKLNTLPLKQLPVTIMHYDAKFDVVIYEKGKKQQEHSKNREK